MASVVPALAQDNTQSQTSPTSTQASANSSTTAQPAATDNTPPSPADDPANAASTANAPKETHNKNINDIDNIGNRNVGSTGKSVGNWYGIDTDVKLGKQYAMMVESNARMIQDPVIVEYVNRVGQNLVRNSDAKVPFTIKVVDSDDINAFALPGGFFYVNSGLILAADNEAELAGVMAHEIAHVAARHQTREMTRGNYAQMATIPLILVNSWGVYEAANLAMSLAIPAAFMKFQRGFEGEADYLGLQYMYKAGYDPQAFIDFFEKVKALEKEKPGLLSKTFSSHPPTPDRIMKSQEEIRKCCRRARSTSSTPRSSIRPRRDWRHSRIGRKFSRRKTSTSPRCVAPKRLRTAMAMGMATLTAPRMATVTIVQRCSAATTITARRPRVQGSSRDALRNSLMPEAGLHARPF